jgi:hypothetical protein
VTFDLLSCRVQLAARRAIRFPVGLAGNVLRGVLGHTLREFTSAEEYGRIFEPAARSKGPSGFADWPRPFVIRASALDGRVVESGEQFCFSLNWFDGGERLEPVIRAFGHWADLVAVDRSGVSIELSPRTGVSRIRVAFQTPTDLRTLHATFTVLLARARDRVSTLRTMYGTGPLDVDFRGLAERARAVETVRSELHQVAIERRSSRTGQRHGIGGFTGLAEYAGDLGEFIPILEAAHWTGVGRHCSWGNGQTSTEILDSDF